jgi:hypothetical protein
MAGEENIVVARPGHRKRSYHIWTHEQRVCLFLLAREFQNLNVAVRAKVFNKIFETKLATCNIPFPGLRPNAVYLEYWKSTTPGMTARYPWKDVYIPPDTVKEHTMRGSLRARIASVLSSNGIEAVWVESTEFRSSGNLTAQSTLSEQDITEIQTPEKRKRPAATLMTPPSTRGDDEEDIADEDEFDRQFSPRKTSRRNYQRHGSPVVFVPSSAEASDSASDPRDPADSDDSLARSAHSPESPKAMPRSIRPVTSRSQTNGQRVNTHPQSISGARSEMLLRRNMAPIPITPEKHRAAQAPFRDISEEEAHPPLPRFLFRAFTAESQGLNSPNGFVCGRYAGARAPPPGPPGSPDLNEILEHLDPSKTLLKCSKCQKVGKCCNKTLHQKIPSSYISTSSDLIWVIRKMISQGEESYISVIDTSTLDPLSVFYVPPYQRELARKQLFHGREHRYKGYSEHLVYNEIPGPAIVKTFSYQELVAFSESDRLTRETLRLPELWCSGTSSTDVLKTMKQKKLRITPQVAVIIANFVMFLDRDSSAPKEGIAFLVCEIVRGWALQIAGTTAAERRESADRFMDAFYRKSDKVLSFEEMSKLKYA